MRWGNVGRWLIAWAWTSLLLFSSCDSGDEPLEVSEVDYFPLVIGQYSVYQVDSSYYRSNILTSQNYFMKVKTVKATPNSEGGTTFTLSLEKRTSSSNPWRPLATYSARISGNKLIVTESNTSFVKLLLPPEKGLRWNGNDFNSLGGKDVCNSNQACDLYSFITVGDRFTLSSSLDFENTLTVEQENSVDDVTGDDVRREVYANGVGLVLKETRTVRYCTKDCIREKFINTGLIYKLTLVENGKE